MKQQTYFGLALVIAFNSVLLVRGSPSFTFAGIKFGSDSFENEYENVNSKIYNIITSLGEKKGKCMRKIRVTGNGIEDSFNIPCSSNGVISTISDKILIYGNPKDDSFFLFSDEPSNLVALYNGKCTRRMYKTENKKTTKDKTELREDECNLIQNNIMFIESQESKYLDALEKHYEERSLKYNKYTNYGRKSKSVPDNQQTDTRSSKSKSPEPPKASSVDTKTQNLPKDPLGLYSQFQQASNDQPTNLESVSESHQKIPHNGITVTEQVSATNNIDHSLGETPTSNKRVEVEEHPETSSTQHHSYLNFLESAYQKLKSEVSAHLASNKRS